MVKASELRACLKRIELLERGNANVRDRSRAADDLYEDLERFPELCERIAGLVPRLAKDRSSYVRGSVAEIFGQFPRKQRNELRPLFRKLLSHDNSTEVRLACLDSIIVISCSERREFLPAIKAMLSNPNPYVCQMILGAICELPLRERRQFLNELKHLSLRYQKLLKPWKGEPLWRSARVKVMLSEMITSMENSKRNR